MKRGKVNWNKLFIDFVFMSFILSIILSVIALIDISLFIKSNKYYTNESNQYTLILLQSILGLIIMQVPSFLEYKFKVKVTLNMQLLFDLFLYCAIYLGEVKRFYYLIPYWDKILHLISGFVLVAIGFSLLVSLNRMNSLPINFNPLCIAIFSFCFAVTLGVIWEIYEFSCDGLLNLNMQKFALENGNNLIGRDALTDTMIDLIMDCIGAGILSLIGYISLKYNKGWIDKTFLVELN
jgi:hypothetical protein